MEDVIWKYINISDASFIAGTTMGLVALLSDTGLKKRYKPISAIFIGIGIAFLVMGFTKLAILTGIVSPLVAMGFWSGAKTSFKSEVQDYTSL